MTISAAPARQGEPLSGETRLMLRAAQLYYRLNLTQDQVGERLGVSRFKVGRLLDRALRESAVRIEIVHPAARLVELEDALVERFGLRGAVVVDVPATGSAAGRRAARPRARGGRGRRRTSPRSGPSGAIGVSWGRTMLELAAHLRPGLDRRHRDRPAQRRHLAVGAPHAGPRDRGALRDDDRRRHPADGRTRDRRLARAAAGARGATPRSARRSRPRAARRHRGLRDGRPGARTASTSRRATSTRPSWRRSADAGAVGDVLGRFLTLDGRIALPSLDARTVGLPARGPRGRRR